MVNGFCLWWFTNVFAVNAWKFDIEITPIACCERKFVPFLVGISRILRRCILVNLGIFDQIIIASDFRWSYVNKQCEILRLTNNSVERCANLAMKRAREIPSSEKSTHSMVMFLLIGLVSIDARTLLPFFHLDVLVSCWWWWWCCCVVYKYIFLVRCSSLIVVFGRLLVAHDQNANAFCAADDDD